jgi:hypothetical protein
MGEVMHDIGLNVDTASAVGALLIDIKQRLSV